MKKIILFLGILITFSVSIRFITSGIIQDDFNFIHFSSISQKALSHHHSKMLSLVNVSYIISWTLIILLVVTFIFYTIYNLRIDDANQSKINYYHMQLETERNQSESLNIKEELYKSSLRQLQVRVQIIEADLNSIDLKPTEEPIKIKLDAIKVMAQQLLQLLGLRL
jgi:hypothetical protein